jgi:hypothetical protein
VFFTSAEGLTEDAIDNGRTKVYEFSQSDGLSVAAQATASNANYADSSPDGKTLWFTTADALIPQLDTDLGFIDVYAARVGGGFPLPVVDGSDVGGPAPSSGAGGGTPDAPSLPSQQPSPSTPPPATPLSSGGDLGDEPASRPGLRLDGRRAAVDGRRVRFAVASTAPGQMVMRLQQGKRILAKGGRRLVASGTETVSLRLTKDGRRLLSEGRHRLRLVSEFRSVDGERVARRWRVVVSSGEEGRR